MLTGKTALITGSTSGIGLAVARAFVQAGARIVITSERPRAQVSEVDSILAAAENHYVETDLSRDGEPERLLSEAWELLGGIDVLVNNVGTYREPPLLEMTRRDFDFVFGLNVWGSIALVKEMVRRAVPAARGGRILFSSSLNASRSEPRHTLYDASKGAVNALTRQLAIELAPLGFTTAAIAPGLVETPLTDFGLRSDPAGRRAIEEQIPLRRIANVGDIAAWFVFLACDHAAYATGTIITVDGGLDAQQLTARPISAIEQQRAKP